MPMINKAVALAACLLLSACFDTPPHPLTRCSRGEQKFCTPENCSYYKPDALPPGCIDGASGSDVMEPDAADTGPDETMDTSTPDCSNLDDPCNTGTYDPTAGACAKLPRPDGTTCNDGLVCTQNDVCNAGTCNGEAVVCDDGKACTKDSCSEDHGGCVADAAGCACSSNDDCADDNACNGVETCGRDLTCVKGTDVDCSGLDGQCTKGQCNKVTGACAAAPTPGKECDDGIPCTVDDVCLQNGVCQGEANTCDDKNSCTSDECEPVSGDCKNTVLEGSTCNDADPCTDGDVCLASGQCQGAVIDCKDEKACTVDTCEKATGQCVHDTVGCDCTEDADCIDASECTEDHCDLSSGKCANTITTGLQCDDSNACTDDDECTGTGVCQGTAVICNDSNPCTQDACALATGECEYSPLTGIVCEDGNKCTIGDVCKDGSCEGIALDCTSFGDQCNDGVCDTDSGACKKAPVEGGACDDQDACSVGDVCTDGACVGVTESNGGGDEDFWLVITDGLGEVIADKTFGWTGEEIAEAVVELDDGRLALAGSTTSKGQGFDDGWLVFADQNGEQVGADQTYGTELFEWFKDLAVLGDGRLALVGGTGVRDDDGEAAFYLVLTDAQGFFATEIVFPAWHHDFATSVSVLPEGPVVLLGPSWVDNDTVSARLVFADTQGQQIGEDLFFDAPGLVGGGDLLSWPSALAMSGERLAWGGYARSGSAKPDGWIVVTDHQGAEISNESIGEGASEGFLGASALSGDRFAFVGSAQPSAADGSGWLVITDSKGQQLGQSHTFGDSSDEGLISIAIMPNGGFALAGGTGDDGWLVFTDEQGNLCGED